MRTLTPEQAEAYYDRLGHWQDSQSFYEAGALAALVRHADFGSAGTVFEFGCGTGKFAFDLLQRHLPATATYVGIDISATMVRLARKRLKKFGNRATVSPATGGSSLPVANASVDRLVSTYVFDLLSASAQQHVLAEAVRVLRPGGLLCLCGITPGTTPLSRVVMAAWQWLFARNPRWVGGCRPIRAAKLLPAHAWELRHHEVVTAWGVASEVVIASPRR
jgi:ubiquinone/menaquinone biosynthesis C-methylase UbiE